MVQLVEKLFDTQEKKGHTRILKLLYLDPKMKNIRNRRKCKLKGQTNVVIGLIGFAESVYNNSLHYREILDYIKIIIFK